MPVDDCPWLVDALAAFSALADGQYLWVHGGDFSSRSTFARHMNARAGWAECCCLIDDAKKILPTVCQTCDALDEPSTSVCIELLRLDADDFNPGDVREALQRVRDGHVGVEQRHLIVITGWSPPPAMVTPRCVFMAV